MSISNPFQEAATMLGCSESNIVLIFEYEHNHHKPDGTVGEIITAKKWNPNPNPEKVGFSDPGLNIYGFVWGEGGYFIMEPSHDKRILAVESTALVPVPTFHVEGVFKFEKAFVCCVGDTKTVTDYLQKYSENRVIIGAQICSGDFGTSISGEGGISISGFQGDSISGGISVSGSCGKSVSKTFSMSGYCGVSISGNGGHSISGIGGVSVSGHNGISQTICGKAKTGENGQILLHWWDPDSCRDRTHVLYTGENGIEPNTFYEVKFGKVYKSENQS